MNSRRTRRRFTLAIIFASIANIFLISLWFYVKVSPVVTKINDMSNTLSSSEISNNYDSMEKLKEEFNRIENQYNVVFSLEDSLGNEIITNKSNKKMNLTILSKIVKIDNEPYLVRAYSTSKGDITKIFIKLLVFEIAIITIILILILLFTRQIIFKPVEKIVNDIRNYKFGKKPVRNEINNEFDIIQNEFVNLTDLLDDEKKEQMRIIASISHDIKTPLTSIIGYSNLLNDDDITKGEVKKFNQKINSKALHIKDILNSFDDYLINQDNITLKMDLITIKDLVVDLYNDYKVELESKNISFDINTKLDDRYIMVDILKIKRVFSNIISNSVRYLKDGGHIHIEIVEEGFNFIKFSISDDGEGVDENIINKIFEPLFTTDSSRKISGLGLSICKEFIELHNGTIRAYNNSGLTIEFVIPEYIKKAENN